MLVCQPLVLFEIEGLNLAFCPWSGEREHYVAAIFADPHLHYYFWSKYQPVFCPENPFDLPWLSYITASALPNEEDFNKVANLQSYDRLMVTSLGTWHFREECCHLIWAHPWPHFKAWVSFSVEVQQLENCPLSSFAFWVDHHYASCFTASIAN